MKPNFFAFFCVFVNFFGLTVHETQQLSMTEKLRDKNFSLQRSLQRIEDLLKGHDTINCPREF